VALVSPHPLLPWNFRDLGGAPANGGRVASGRLFRTAHLSAIGEESAVHVQETLGVEAYIDFRADEDIVRDGAPKALLARGVRWQRYPFDISDAAFTAIATPRPEDWRGLYTRAFLRLRPELAGAIRLIAHAKAPLVFGCWAGKDRTGMVAALTLSLLGVSDEGVAADFALTGASLFPAKDRFSFLWKDRPSAEAAIIQAHLRTEPESIVGFLSDVRQRFGSVSRALELPDSVLAALAARYLDPA